MTIKYGSRMRLRLQFKRCIHFVFAVHMSFVIHVYSKSSHVFYLILLLYTIVTLRLAGDFYANTVLKTWAYISAVHALRDNLPKITS